MIPSILVLTDFSADADHALRYAADFAERRGAHLVLLHVDTHTALLDPERFTGKRPKRSPAATRQALDDCIRGLPVAAVAEIGEGTIAKVVAEVAARYDPAFVVVGRPRTENLPDELVTTTALDLLRATPYPLLIVPYSVALNGPPHRLLLAADEAPFTLGQYAGPPRQVFNHRDTELIVVHVTTPGTPVRVAAQNGAAALAAVLEAGLTAEHLTAKLQRVANADPAEGILATAEKLRSDLLVLIARPHSFLRRFFHLSVTAQVIRQSAIPVLVLPATEPDPR